jgi:hypothetical protein
MPVIHALTRALFIGGLLAFFAVTGLVVTHVGPRSQLVLLMYGTLIAAMVGYAGGGWQSRADRAASASKGEK